MKRLTFAILAILLVVTTTTHATLVSSLGGQVVNDTDLNITWLADANLAATNTFGVSGITAEGKMSWNTAQTWITAMNAVNYLGYSDWRLPSTTDTGAPGIQCTYNGTDCGYNSTGSEMSYLFYTGLGNLGYYNTAGVPQSGYGLINTGSFTNFQSSFYWSSEYAFDLNGAWVFHAGHGYQNAGHKTGNMMFTLAVRTGQVATVSVPAAAWLFGSGLIGLIGFAKRKTRE